MFQTRFRKISALSSVFRISKKDETFFHTFPQKLRNLSEIPPLEFIEFPVTTVLSAILARQRER